MNKARKRQIERYYERCAEREAQDIARAEELHQNPEESKAFKERILNEHLQYSADRIRMNRVHFMDYDFTRRCLSDAIKVERLELLDGRDGMLPWDFLVQKVNRGCAQIYYPPQIISHVLALLEAISVRITGDLYNRFIPRAQPQPIIEAGRKVAQSYFNLTGIIIEDNPLGTAKDPKVFALTNL